MATMDVALHKKLMAIKDKTIKELEAGVVVPVEAHPVPACPKVIVDFDDGGKVEVDVGKLVVGEGQCVRVSQDFDGSPIVAVAEYDELECTSGG